MNKPRGRLEKTGTTFALVCSLAATSISKKENFSKILIIPPQALWLSKFLKRLI